MSNVNTVVVSGNLTRDPELRWTSEDGSSSIVNLGIATNRSRKSEGGEYVDEVSFFDVDVFGGFANLVGKKLKKGDSATVSGRLEQQKFTVDGVEKSKVVIIGQQIDSEGFFRSAAENNTLVVGQKAATEAAPAAAAAETAAPTTAAPTDDDIPF